MEIYYRRQEQQSEIFKIWAQELIPNQLSEDDWKFFYEKLNDKKYFEKASKNNLPLLQIVHPYSVTVGWLKKQPKTQFLDVEIIS